MLDTAKLPFPSSFPTIFRGRLETLQVNLGYRCNQACTHCHVGAGPTRTEQMNIETVETVLQFLRAKKITTLDLTGGAPELNPHFRELVVQARGLGVTVIDRCNLTILNEPEQEGLASFLAQNRVDVMASLPCYLKENVDKQRGRGSYQNSLSGLRKLNELGYGVEGSGLIVNLVYNPQGPFLPPEQNTLEQDYRKRLFDQHGLLFNRLLTITNMPIQRFGQQLRANGGFSDYMRLLRESYRPENLDSVMCRNLLSVDWRGFTYDCDFNQMLHLPFIKEDKQSHHLSALMSHSFEDSEIQVGEHCFACTAGQGSSCAGALAGS